MEMILDAIYYIGNILKHLLSWGFTFLLVVFFLWVREEKKERKEYEKEREKYHRELEIEYYEQKLKKGE